MYCYIEDYGNQKFYIDTGAVLSEEFNEKIDSFSFILSNVETEIAFKQYQYFKIVSETSDFNRTFVLDNYTKRMVNLNGTKHYEYTILLQSETKLLETFPCPNRQILHSLVNGQKTLLQVIREVCELYVPYVKMTTSSENWGYGHFIDCSDIRDIANPLQPQPDAFSTTLCPDLQFTKTSLREVLTTLFQVVGYLPIVREHKLCCMNLREIPSEFEVVENRILEKQESNSSDSFVTTLRSPLKNALDNDNVVRNEVIGFRDSRNVFLKQKENFVLTTDFPIESIKKLAIRPFWNVFWEVNRPSGAALNYVVQFNGDGTKVLFSGMPISTQFETTIEFYMCDNPYLIGGIDQYFSGEPHYVQTVNVPLNATEFDLTPYLGTFSFFIIRGKATAQGQTIGRTSLLSNNFTNYLALYINLKSIDLTPIVKEKQERNALDVDYTNIPTPTTTPYEIDLSPLGASYYTTLEYTYGGNVISGFSNNWDWFTAFGQMENVLLDYINNEFVRNVALYDFDYVERKTSEFANIALKTYKLTTADLGMSGITISISSSHRALYPQYINSKIVKYALCVFEIEYIPFNQITIETQKDMDLPIEYTRFDTQESSIIMLDNFSARELDKVKRLGNKVLQVQQTQTSSFNNIQPLNSILDGSVVFSRSIEFYENPIGISFYNASYVATKDYVLKNFFTALQNKYRAYEYVEVNESVLRQELRKSYVYVDVKDNKLLNGSIKFGSNDYYFLLSTIIVGFSPLKYAIVGERAYTTTATTSYKYDLSVVGTNDAIVISHIEPYPNHYGIEIRDANENTTLENLGGYIQGWLPHSETYKTMHRLGYSSIDALIGEGGFVNLENSIKAPMIELLEEEYANNFVFWVKDDNFYNVNYYSNVGERLSDCVEFVYYTPNNAIKISKNFTQYHRLSVNNGYRVRLIERDSENLNEGWYQSVATIIRGDSAFKLSSYEGGATLLIRNISAYSSSYGVLALYDEANDKYLDVMGLKLSECLDSSGNLQINFSLNDTKTLLVYDTTDSIWELNKKVVLNSSDRRFESI